MIFETAGMSRVGGLGGRTGATGIGAARTVSVCAACGAGPWEHAAAKVSRMQPAARAAD
ncbi:hypothetical protein [Mycolicibacterium sp.]|uniref:hypothetical protein n=1 Tax=Mycolicibacterium sp. TaxID=2320850 RepID=UPI0037C67AC7